MIEVLTGVITCFLIVLCMHDGIAYFGEDKNSPLMKTLSFALIILFIVCVGIAFSI